MNRNTAIAASIEVIAKQILANDELDQLFPQGTRVYIPDVGSDEVDTLVAAAKKLAVLGFRPVPHFPARRLTSADEVDMRLQRFTSEAGVDDVLIIGGGLEQEAGEFASTMDVIETGLLDKYNITKIGVAGHPEGSPDFDDVAAQQALRSKQEYANRTDASMRIVTQFGFDADSFIAWAKKLGEQGIDLPVHLGVAGPAKLTTLVKFAVMCGVGPSVEFLKKRASAVTTLLSGFDAETVVGPIEQYMQSSDNSAITQIHVFPFGGAKKSSVWLQERGSWTI